MNQIPTRNIETLVRGVDTHDGAGVKLTRVLSGAWQQRLDPFLMLDAFQNDQAEDYLGGFPDHPHRGFETITYMLAGKMRHRDSAGNEGLLVAGGAQWMIAGSGLIHSEMPEQESGRMEGFQFWLNLPAADKMTAPRYRDLAPTDIPEHTFADGVRVRVLAGRLHTEAGVLVGAVERPHTAPMIWDIHLPPGAHFAHALPVQHHAFVYVYRGAIVVHGKKVPTQTMGVLDNQGAGFLAQDANADKPTEASEGFATRFLWVAGAPLQEPIAQHGPFVMNSLAELQQAFADYHAGAFMRPPMVAWD